MNKQEEELLTMLRAEFAAEAVEHLDGITAGLLALEKAPAGVVPMSVVESIYRQAHSLKGEARAVNYQDIEVICQALESVFSAWKRGGFQQLPGTLDTLHSVLDSIRAMLAMEGAMPVGQRDEIVNTLALLLKGRGHAGPVEVGVSGAPQGAGYVAPNRGEEKAPTGDGKTGPEESVRMPLGRLEALLLGLEEMLSVKLTLIRRAEALRDAVALIEQGKRQGVKINTEIRSFAGVQAALPPILDDVLERNQATVNALGTALVALSREAEQDAHAVNRLVDNLLDQSKRLLMMPFNSLLGILPKMVRDLCRDQGKDADVVIQGGDIEIDKRILQELKDALIHLVRNCVDHGIETAAVREKKNKPERGTITVEVLPVDTGKVELVIRDDGAGIDMEAVKQSAVRHGVISAADAARLSRDMAISLIFRSSVSTSSSVTAVSGRGLGMAIVKERVESLGGRVIVETTPDKGSTFRIIVPLTLATFRGTFVAASGRCFILPSANVEKVARIRPDQIVSVENREVIALGGHTLSYVGLAAVLGLPSPEKAPGHNPLVPIVVAVSGDKRVAFHVEDILTEQEVLLKSFAKPLSRVRNVGGATVLASGRVVPILNVADLIKSSALAGMPCAPASVPGRSSPSPVPERSKTLLLVEDSIISRMLFKSILESAGYVVKTAVDGEDAWEAMQRGIFDAVVSDIEMPRLNGFDLTARIRHDARFGDRPVILVTGLSSPEDRARGIEVGANAYIVKSSFDQSDLLEALRRVV